MTVGRSDTTQTVSSSHHQLKHGAVRIVRSSHLRREFVVPNTENVPATCQEGGEIVERRAGGTPVGQEERRQFQMSAEDRLQVPRPSRQQGKSFADPGRCGTRTSARATRGNPTSKWPCGSAGPSVRWAPVRRADRTPAARAAQRRVHPFEAQGWRAVSFVDPAIASSTRPGSVVPSSRRRRQSASHRTGGAPAPASVAGAPGEGRPAGAPKRGAGQFRRQGWGAREERRLAIRWPAISSSPTTPRATSRM